MQVTEINITEFFNVGTFIDYSASVAEIGTNAGPETWNNASEAVEDHEMLKTDEQRQAMRDWAESSGGWDDDEIAAWSDTELNALFIQLVSGDIRECSLEQVDWEAYEKECEAGNAKGCIFRGDDGQIYYELSE